MRQQVEIELESDGHGIANVCELQRAQFLLDEVIAILDMQDARIAAAYAHMAEQCIAAMCPPVLLGGHA